MIETNVNHEKANKSPFVKIATIVIIFLLLVQITLTAALLMNVNDIPLIR